MNQQLILIFLFLLGYAAIAFESFIKINKAASAIITAVFCWTVLILSTNDVGLTNTALDNHLSQISGILFFLLGAMTIVELIDMNRGFEVITKYVEGNNGTKLLWKIGFISFFLSSVLDNLTTTIVMISLLKKIIKDQQLRLIFVSIVVIAANAGGAWTPIGDVTTTMLWIKGQITTVPIMTKLFLPSIACLVIPLIYFQFKLKIQNTPFKNSTLVNQGSIASNRRSKSVFILGISSLLFVPIFKGLTGLPPYISILFGLSAIWIYTDYINGKEKDGVKHTISDALQKIDTPTVLFFLGILLSVAALEFSGILSITSTHLTQSFKNEKIIVSVIGLISSVVDNVPLVAAVQGMKSLPYQANHDFWILLAYCAGTGGSILIIGSAAGVAAMGKEKIDFFWYLRNISLVTFLGYVSGIFIFIGQQLIF